MNLAKPSVARLQTLSIVAALGFFLAGCAAVTQESVSADHKKIYGIDCSGKAIPMSKCYAKAQEMCPRGYTVISNEAPTQPSIDTPLHQLSDSIAYSIPGVKKGITVKCR